MSILQICMSIEGSALGTFVRESLYGFQALVAIHILGLTLSVGTLLWWDLRLLGVGLRNVRVSELYRRLMPWTLTGFLVMFITGLLLFTGFATKAYGNIPFRIKITAQVLAAANALVYHSVTERRIARWDEAARPPLGARIAGLTSIVLWAVVIMCGRLISYTMF